MDPQQLPFIVKIGQRSFQSPKAPCLDMEQEVNGLQASKLALWDAVQYHRDFDVILLSETRAIHFPDNLLPRHPIAYCPASLERQGGEGLLVAL
jgi:hypothetical protein